MRSMRSALSSNGPLSEGVQYITFSYHIENIVTGCRSDRHAPCQTSPSLEESSPAAQQDCDRCRASEHRSQRQSSGPQQRTPRDLQYRARPAKSNINVK